MSNSVTISQRILTMANCYDRGSTRQAREEGYRISQAPATTNSQKWIQKQVEDILEADRFAPESNPSSGSEEPPQKRRAVDTTDKVPEVLDIHWKALRCCNRGENQAFFLRVKARALRALVMKNQLENLPSGQRECFMSFLKTQDLCSLSECSTELNYRIQTMSRIWQRLGKAFELPADYWPNEDFSKKRCVSNFKAIVRANRELTHCTESSNPLLPFFTRWSGRSPQQFRVEITDPQEHFTRHTLPAMTALMLEDSYAREGEFNARVFDMRQTSRGVIPFGPMHDRFGTALRARTTPNAPYRLVHLFWTCGYPIHRHVLGSVIHEFAEQKERQALSHELSSAWLSTLEWMATCIPKWTDPRENRDGDWYSWYINNDPLAALYDSIYRPHQNGFFTQQHNRISSQEARRLDGLVLQLLQKGETTHYDLDHYFARGLPLEFFNALLGAMKDKSHLPRMLSKFLDRSFKYWNLDPRFRIDGVLVDPELVDLRFSPETILSAAPLFKGPRGLEDIPADLQFRVEWEGPNWIYLAAKAQSRPLLDLLFEIGIPSNFTNGDPVCERNSLSLALRDVSPPEVVLLLCEYGVKPTSVTRQYASGYLAVYGTSPEVVTQLNAALGF